MATRMTADDVLERWNDISDCSDSEAETEQSESDVSEDESDSDSDVSDSNGQSHLTTASPWKRMPEGESTKKT